ncbi:MAG: YdjY domain-containing protein [Phycisphaerae bacterium]
MNAAGIGFAVAWTTAVTLCSACHAPPNRPDRPTTQPGRRTVFATGVTIDWRAPQVELAGRVVLDQGLLELFACSRGTREHESIVAVDAQPQHIYQALGLIGLTPGRPVTYDPDADHWRPPTGDRLSVDVRFAAGQTHQMVSAWSWLLNAETNRPATPRHWIFSGSRTFPGDVFGADADGTVVCVVDFDTALIGLAEPHSADNALLWVAANPKTVPAPGTPCTLILRPVQTAQWLIDVDRRGRFRLDDAWQSAGQLVAALRSATPPKSRPILLLPLPDVDPATLKRCRVTLQKAGLTHVSVADPPDDDAPAKKPPPTAGKDG